MALGSAFELETQLLILKEIEYLNYTEILSLLEMIKEEQKMLQGFIKKLKTTS